MIEMRVKLGKKAFIKEQRQHFSDIGDGIKGALNQSDRNFNATMNRTAALLQTETGGDSFCYVTFERSGFQDDCGAVAYHRGGYALRDLTIRIVDIHDKNRGHREADRSN